jgi:hypothetical protein
MKVIPETDEGYSRNWWRLFQKLMKVIPEIDEGYSRNWWRLFLKLMKVIPEIDEGYSRNWWRLFQKLMKVIPETDEGYSRNWWRLFQKRVVRNKFDIYIFIHTNIFCSSQVVKKKIHKWSVKYCAFLDSLQTHCSLCNYLAKLDIYVFNSITESIPLLVDYLSQMVSSTHYAMLRHWHWLLLDIFMLSIYSNLICKN